MSARKLSRKQIEAFNKGRAIANAKKFKKANGKLILEGEFVNAKVLLRDFPISQVVGYTGRSKNTLVRISKSANYSEYRELLAKELGGRKNRATKPVLGSMAPDPITDRIENLEYKSQNLDDSVELHYKSLADIRVRQAELSELINSASRRAAFSLSMAVCSVIFAAALVFMRQ